MSTDDGAAPVASHPAAVRDREDAVVVRLQALAADLDDAPDPAFRAATRDRLVAMAAVRPPQPAPSRLRRLVATRADDALGRPWRTRLTTGLAGAALTVTTLAALVALATDAGPGDVLYGVKRGTEQSRLALAGDDRGLTLLQFATTRLAEVDALDGAGPADVVVALLDTMDAQTAEGAALLAGRAVAGGDAAPLHELAGWAAEQTHALTVLAPELTAGTDDAARESADLLARVTDRAAGLAVALSCPGGPATAGTDALGPVPAPCATGTDVAPPATAAPQAPATGSTPGMPAPGSAASPTPPPAPAPEPGPTAGAPGGTGVPVPATPPSAEAPQVPTSTRAGPAPGGARGVPGPAVPTPTVTRPPRTPPPPLVETPLPICLPFLVC
ncbi:DUF5667 domain-containing protein [Geodermatophilus sp. SYSU D00742]